MSTHRLVQLEASLDEALNQFELTQNTRGEYPWQQQQREKRNRRALVVGAGATAAGAAGAAGAHQIMRRYGGYEGGGAKGAFREAGRDAMRAGQEVAGRAQKAVTDAAGSAVQAGKNLAGKVQKTASNAVMRGRASWRTTGEMAMPLMKRVGKAVKAGARAIGWYSAGNLQRLVELEAALDGALEFSDEDRGQLMTGLPNDWRRHGEGGFRKGPDGKLVKYQKSYGKPRKIAPGQARQVVANNDGVKSYDDRSPSRTRRVKAVAGMLATGAAGYAAGKYGKGLVQKGKAMLKK